MKETVFILGAGASIPFGYPSGKELKKIILSTLHPNYIYSEHVKYHIPETGEIAKEYFDQNFSDYDLYLRAGFNSNLIDNFRIALEGAMKDSIDSFLLSRQEFLEIGKFAITNVLLKFEHKNKITLSEDDNWLNYIWNRINNKLEDFIKAKIAFITFNYDRTVEQFFYLSLKYAFNLNDEKILDILKHKPIIHLHGRLGFLPWENEKDSFNYNFNFSSLDKHYENILKAAKNIKIVYDDDLGKEPFKKAKDIIQFSNKTYMLGLGFNQLNIERLGLHLNSAYSRIHQIICSAHGLTKFEKIQIRNKWQNLYLDTEGHKNLEFLRNHLEL